MTRPRSVRIGPFTWRIVEQDPADLTTMAETALRELVIRIEGAVHEDVWRETLLHELLHACHITAGIVDADAPVTAEAVVGATSPLLLEVLRRDKRLRAYLFGEAP